MDKVRWQQIEKIVDKALELPTKEDKEHYIKRVCKDDKQLHRQVKQLLEAITKAGENNFLEI